MKFLEKDFGRNDSMWVSGLVFFNINSCEQLISRFSGVRNTYEAVGANEV